MVVATMSRVCLTSREEVRSLQKHVNLTRNACRWRTARFLCRSRLLRARLQVASSIILAITQKVNLVLQCAGRKSCVLCARLMLTPRNRRVVTGTLICICIGLGFAANCVGSTETVVLQKITHIKNRFTTSGLRNNVTRDIYFSSYESHMLGSVVRHRSVL